MLLIDTREKLQAIKGIKAYLDRCGIAWRDQKLDIGDYQLAEAPGLAVDRKRNLGELLTNLCSNDKARFWREVRKARAEGIKLVVLCEHGGKIRHIPDVADWHSPYSRVTGRELMERIYACHISYGVEFMFCDKRQTARRIIDILGEKICV